MDSRQFLVQVLFQVLKAAGVSGLGLPKLLKDWLQRYYLAICCVQKRALMLSAQPGQADVIWTSHILAPSFVILKGERKCYSLHSLSDMVWKTSTVCLPKKLCKEAESRVQPVPVRTAGTGGIAHHWKSSRIKQELPLPPLHFLIGDRVLKYLVICSLWICRSRCTLQMAISNPAKGCNCKEGSPSAYGCCGLEPAASASLQASMVLIKKSLLWCTE